MLGGSVRTNIDVARSPLVCLNSAFMRKPAKPFEQFEEELASLVDRFSRNLTQYKGPDYNEARLRDDFLNPFFSALGWDVSNRAGLIQSKREVEIESAKCWRTNQTSPSSRRCRTTSNAGTPSSPRTFP